MSADDKALSHRRTHTSPSILGHRILISVVTIANTSVSMDEDEYCQLEIRNINLQLIVIPTLGNTQTHTQGAQRPYG